MPEDAEVDLDKIRETIDEELERKGSSMLRMIALTTALLAALAAIASLQAGATVNEALALKTEATQLQARASDQWAYYQAREIKGDIARASIVVWQAAGKAAPDSLITAAARYTRDQTKNIESARALEHERDARTVEADHLLHRHHSFADAVALFQVAIALGAVTALTRSRPVYAASLLLGAAGIAVLGWVFLA